MGLVRFSPMNIFCPFEPLSNVNIISSPILPRAIYTSDFLSKILYEFVQVWYVRVQCSSDVILNDAFPQNN